MGFDKASVLHVLIWMLASLITADVAVTYVGITWFGATEGNPLYYLLGMGWFMTLKVVGLPVSLWVIWRLRDMSISWVSVGTLCGLYWVLLVNNLVVMTG